MKKLTLTAMAVAALALTGQAQAAKPAKKAPAKAPAKAAKAPAKGKAATQKGIDHSDTALAARLGTLGIGLEVSKPIDENWNGRFGLNWFSKNDDRTESGIAYDGDLDLNTYAFLVDYHGKNSGWRATAGFMLNYNEVDLKASTTATTGVTIGSGATAVAVPAGTAGQLRANVDFNTFAPYLGVGYGNPFSGKEKERDWSFSLDLGVLFQGSPDASVTSTFAAATAASLAQERAELENAIDDFDIYPVIAIGAAYRF